MFGRANTQSRMNTSYRVWFCVFSAPLWLAMLAPPAHGVALRVGVVRGFPGNTVEVPVSLNYRSNELHNVVALQADILFDASGITGGTPSSGALLSRHVLASSAPSPGVRRLLVYSLENAVLTNGTLAHIPFIVGLNEFRNFSLTLSNVILVRADATQIPATNANGFVGVNQVFVAPDGHADGFLTVVSNEVEQCYVVQATTDFASWANVSTNSTTGPLLEFAEADVSSYSRRFYRAVLCEDISGTRLRALERLGDGRIRFEFTGATGRSYLIQASTNLVQWEDISSGLSGSLIQFTDPGSTNRPYRFYRVRAQ